MLEDNEAAFKMTIKQRSPHMQYVNRTHRGNIDVTFETLKEDEGLWIKYVNTKQQIADMLTKGSFIAIQRSHLLQLAQIRASSAISSFAVPILSATEAMAAQSAHANLAIATLMPYAEGDLELNHEEAFHTIQSLLNKTYLGPSIAHTEQDRIKTNAKALDEMTYESIVSGHGTFQRARHSRILLAATSNDQKKRNKGHHRIHVVGNGPIVTGDQNLGLPNDDDSDVEGRLKMIMEAVFDSAKPPEIVVRVMPGGTLSYLTTMLEEMQSDVARDND